ncbi:MAG: FAD-dependent oxidoreductase [Tissierella sp.]|uniref:FAD-dependent oxidoreductase n=1 Tax=Tissierella sp. TaxID=41274 RepID=UPI003F9B27BD
MSFYLANIAKKVYIIHRSDKLGTINEFIVTDKSMQTNIPGIFAAGDIINKSIRQGVTSASDGAIAGVSASL